MTPQLLRSDQKPIFVQSPMSDLTSNQHEQARIQVLKIFSPAGRATLLIHSMDSDNDTMFGLCDLGMGSPEMGASACGSCGKSRST